MIARPWTFKLELTQGCNLRCDFCPIATVPWGGDRRFMAPELAFELAAQARTLNAEPRIELTMRGEPTLNPRVADCVAAMRAALPQAQISLFTNGIRFLKEPALAAELLHAGVNILCVDCYNGTYERFQRLLAPVAQAERAPMVDFRSFSAYRRHPGGDRMRVINLVPDIEDPAQLVRVRVVHNQGGNLHPDKAASFGLQPLRQPLRRKCGRPFRELAITNDGHVLLCCHDWGEEAVLGHAPGERLWDIWHGPAHRAHLAALYKGDRSAAPCASCDYHGGFRLGLLKDPEA